MGLLLRRGRREDVAADFAAGPEPPRICLFEYHSNLLLPHGAPVFVITGNISERVCTTQFVRVQRLDADGGAVKVAAASLD